LNEGLSFGAIKQTAMNTFGSSWQAQSKSTDQEFARQAENLINDEWYKICGS